jgi:XTP/dITP diphosphohydrolase
MQSQFPRGRVAFFVTNNVHKFKEVRLVLAEFKVATALIRAKTPEIQDNDIEKISKVNAKGAGKKCNLPIVVDDTGLFIDILNRFPGPYSSYVYQTIGTKGILKLMKDVNKNKRDAYFHTVVTFYDPEKELLESFHGIIEGRISQKERGNSGFGFDPLFEPSKSGGKTFAEMNLNEKNIYSHRAKAFRKFGAWYISRNRFN